MKTRLNTRFRNMLMRHARDARPTYREDEAAQGAYAVASSLVRSCVESMFPPKDMRLLRKYQVAAPDYCIRGCDLDTSRVVQFTFRSDDEGPLTPNRYCSSRSIPFTAETVSAIDAFEKAKAVVTDIEDRRMTDYRALIYAAKTFEDVVEVWAGAEELRASICGSRTQVVALSDDVVARIRADAELVSA